MKPVLTIIAISAVVLGLSGCERTRSALGQSGYVESGIRFKPRVQVAKDDRAAFTVSVRGAQRSLSGAQEAARVGGTRHCIKFYGNSDITWLGASPDDEDVVLERGDLTLKGRCSAW